MRIDRSSYAQGVMSRNHGGGSVATRWVIGALLVLLLSALLAACDLLPGASCPIGDKSFCRFVEKIESDVEGLDSAAVLNRTALECCKGDFAWPDEESYDPQALCVRSGAYRGESSCLTDDEFDDFLSRHAPLSVDYLVDTQQGFSELSIDMGDTAILVSTGDPDWFLVIFADQPEGEWQITAILQVRRTVLAEFPDNAFVSWPPDLQPPNPRPGGIG